MLEFSELKKTYDLAAAAIGRGQEPLEQLVALTRHLRELSEGHATLLKRGKESAEGALPAD